MHYAHHRAEDNDVRRHDSTPPRSGDPELTPSARGLIDALLTTEATPLRSGCSGAQAALCQLLFSLLFINCLRRFTGGVVNKHKRKQLLLFINSK